MKKTYNILLHGAFWTLFAALPLSTIFFNSEPLPTSSVVYIIFVYLLHVVNFYTAFFGLIPLLLKRKNIPLVIGISVLFVIIFTLLRMLVIKSVFYSLDMELEENMKKFMSENSSMFFDYIVQSVVFTGFAYLLRFTFEWFNNEKQRAELINQNQASELALLRYQINPHFLFNTLNNIYSLVYKKDDKAPDAVMKLSEILHYMLYKSNSDQVLLDNEIKYLRSFIELQKLRLGSGNFVQFTVKGFTTGRTIAPMILLPFVENAFKHCNKQAASPGISILLEAVPGSLVFSGRNFIITDEKQVKDETGGIGLQNIRRRLELLYPGKYKLDIEQKNNEFIVNLNLNDR